ncbi:hypothetical protein CLU97_1285 [Chryseobacterium sp. 7]|uniref:hypothetical protein n=1 Tax=Chryseobacterium sp. 7 TaxID=2035214 RepID=UPI000EAF254F|nr:hypothetical protein [Chryseobacterium sp. 7]RLJ31844.1 hypothetical protein CLU97_1285 [Chryseobacterium sp. 7]
MKKLYQSHIQLSVALIIQFAKALLLYYIVDFWLKNKSLAKESTYTIQEKADTVIMADIFEAINRGDGSFMPLFRQLILFL